MGTWGRAKPAAKPRVTEGGGLIKPPSQKIPYTPHKQKRKKQTVPGAIQRGDGRESPLSPQKRNSFFKRNVLERATVIHPDYLLDGTSSSTSKQPHCTTTLLRLFLKKITFWKITIHGMQETEGEGAYCRRSEYGLEKKVKVVSVGDEMPVGLAKQFCLPRSRVSIFLVCGPNSAKNVLEQSLPR